MSGLTEIHELLAFMDPEMDACEYIFATFPGAHYGDLAALKPVACIQEKEGLGLVIERSVAEVAEIQHEVVCRKISLNVHSSLEAVGLTAAVANVLAGEGISANVVAGFYHDHIFVPAKDAEQALRLLRELSCTD